MGRNMIYGLENNSSTYQRRRPLLNKIMSHNRKYDLGIDTNELYKNTDYELELIYYNIILKKINIKINEYTQERDRITQARDKFLDDIREIELLSTTTKSGIIPPL